MPSSSELKASIVPVSSVDHATRAAMWELFAEYYEAVSRDNFERDLAGKDHVILVRSARDKAVQGFSTITSFESKVHGRRVVGVFSGDTIMGKAHWRQTVLQRGFLRYVMGVKLRNPLTPVYWFLISKGYKTYLLLSRNFPEYWPRWDKATPPWQAAVLDDFARRRFPDAWRPELGLLKFAECEGRLKCDVAQVDEKARELPEVRFFEQRNPGHSQGDELCCLGLVSVSQAGSYVLKVARKTLNGRRNSA